MKKVAVILAGCGYLDGSEIRESVLTLLALDKFGAHVEIFAPNIKQHHVINHITGAETSEVRNVLVESARIARGNIKPLEELNPKEFDALIMPGGFGAAKNLANIAFAGAEGFAIDAIKHLIIQFNSMHKPIGSICISPAVVASILKDVCRPILTLGNHSALLEEIGVESSKCNTNDIVIDIDNKLVSTPAYMHDDTLSNIYAGIEKLVKKVLEL